MLRVMPRLLTAAIAAWFFAFTTSCDCTPITQGGGGGGTGGAGGSGGAGGAGGGGVDAGQAGLDAFCADLAAARCARESRCGALDSTSRDFCEARLKASCHVSLGRVRAGAARLDDAGVSPCLAAVNAERCIAGALVLPGACAPERLFVAAAAAGSRCEDSLDCVDSYCLGFAAGCHACLAFAAPGAPCSGTDARCRPSEAYCADPLDGGSRTCRALLADGAVCRHHADCASAWCNWSSALPDAGPDVCGHKQAGQACADPGDCAPDAFCDGTVFDGTSVVPGRCVPRLALGAPCVNQQEDDGCVAGATCLEARCVPVPVYALDAGAECEGPGQCADSLFCRAPFAPQPDGGVSLRSGVCAPRLGAGGPCDFLAYADEDCAEGTTCGAAKTCVPRAAVGAACAAAYECRLFLACPGATGRCEAYRGPGQRCGPGVRCVDGATDAVCDADAGPSVCAPLSPFGAPCDASAPQACASGRCGPRDGGAAMQCVAACFP